MFCLESYLSMWSSIRLSKSRLLVNQFLIQQSKNSWFETGRYLARMDRTVLANPSQSTVRVFQIFLGTQQLLLLQAGDNSACQSTSILLRVFSGFPTSYPGDLFAFTGFLHSARGLHPSFLLLLLLWSPLWHRRLLSLHWISWTRWQPPTQETTLPSPPSSPYSRNAFHKTKCNKSPEKKGPKMPNIKSTKCLSVGMWGNRDPKPRNFRLHWMLIWNHLNVKWKIVHNNILLCNRRRLGGSVILSVLKIRNQSTWTCLRN